ncbi:MAG: sugar ABC transporter ATP-binding protein [Actinobacteria bacterium]|nr:sugar ABC transporter ATP-binding protein [Actinomycetota bacterium]
MDMTLRPGRVHALVGANGSGKSTLIKIITGVERPSAGSIELNGRTEHFLSPAHSIAVGVGVVHQHYHLFPDLSVTDNVDGVLGRLHRSRRGTLDRRRAAREVGAELNRLGIDVDPNARVGSLGPAERKLIEIARALTSKPKYLILDEPTASLEPRSARSVIDLLARLRAEGLAICFVSHRLDEIVEIADEVTVLRDGVRRTHLDRPPRNERELIEEIADVVPEQTDLSAPKEVGRASLSLVGFSSIPGGARGDLVVHAGEVVATHGLIGSGAATAVRMVGGAIPLDGRAIRDGKEIHLRTPRDAQRAGIGFLPEDRGAEGVIAQRSVAENIALASLQRYSRFGVLSRRGMRADAERMREQMNIVCASTESAISTLSGGNQQKALIARWLLSDVEVLAIEEPTSGVDVRGRAQIHGLLREFARRGGAVLVSCSEPEEAVEIADRVLVFRHGSVVGDLLRGVVDEHAVAELSTSGAAQPKEER